MPPPPPSEVGEFPEVSHLLAELGLATTISTTESASVFAIRSVQHTKTLDYPLSTPFPSTPPQTGVLILPKHPDPIEQAAQQKLQDILTPLLANPLLESTRLTYQPLLNVVKTLNLLRLVCATPILRCLVQVRRGNDLPCTQPSEVHPRAGTLPFSTFFKNNPDIVSVISESCEHAYALQHILDPGITIAMRAGLITTRLLFSSDGLCRVRQGDPSVLAFTDEDELIRELKNAKTACLISYRHVMHDSNVTGLCQQQLDSVADDVACYDYVWIDTVYSRASKHRWHPACVTLFGILDCFRTSRALEHHNRTWIKAESILCDAKQEFLSTRPREYIHSSMFLDIQLHAAKKIAGGALEGTESLFSIDKEKLEQWASNAYSFPNVGLSGTLTIPESLLSSVAARDHFDWSVLKSPFWAKNVLECRTRLVSPEQYLLYSMDVNALRCKHSDFVLRFLMRIQDGTHCFYSADYRCLYVLFHRRNVLGSRLLKYEGVSVVNKGQWMKLTDAKYMKEYCLAEEDMVLISTAMAMNSGNRYELTYLEPEPGRPPNDAFLSEPIEGTYEYVARFNVVTGLMERSNSPYPFRKCMQVVKELALRIAIGLQYRKLATIYFGFCDSVSWGGTMTVKRVGSDGQSGGIAYGVEIL